MTLRAIPITEYFDTPQQVTQFLVENSAVAIDTETTGLRVMEDQITLWSIATATRRAACSRYSLAGLIPGLIANPTIILVFHRFMFDLHMLQNAGISIYEHVGPDRLFDVPTMDNILNPNGQHKLKILSKDRLGIPYKSYSEMHFTQEDIGDPEQKIQPSQRFKDYAATDAWATFMIWEFSYLKLLDMKRASKIPKILDEDAPTMVDYYRCIEQPLHEILYGACRRGVRIDIGYLQRLIPVFDDAILVAHKAICDLAGHPVNPNSTQQMAKLLFDELGFPVIKRTATGRSTDEEVLKRLQDLPAPSELAGKVFSNLLSFRQYSKLKSTYAVALLEVLVGDRLHGYFNQHRTDTGRLSSTDPNLQNIPIRTEIGRKIREAFIPTVGYIFLDVDYRQIELRLLAAMSNAPSIRDPILAGIDLHSLTAVGLAGSLGVSGATYEEVLAANDTPKAERTDRQKVLILSRMIAKTINFGVIYGVTEYGLVGQLKEVGIERDKAACKVFLNEYWRNHPDVAAHNRRMIAVAEKHGMARTMLGRVRHIGGLEGNRPNRRSQNQALNTPIQGTAAELLKCAMIQLWRSQAYHDLGIHLLLQVHDELVLEVPERNIEDAVVLVRNTMSVPAFPLSVPLDVDIKTGYNWGGLH